MPERLKQPWTSFVDGHWSASAGASRFDLTDPGDTSTTSTRYCLATAEDVNTAVEAAARTFPSWARTPASERADLIYALIDLWRERIDELAEVVTREMGKPLRESRSEANRAVVEMRYWAGVATRLGDRTFESTRRLTDAYTVRQPIGPVAAITPWNFPILTPIRKVVPALVCGCTVVLKPALQAPGASVMLLQMLEEVGLPPGVAHLLIGGGRDVGEALIQHERIAGITFTGSTQVGLHVGTTAAKRNAKVQLEMGGKNAAVVAAYGDLAHAAREIASAAFAASGQRCTSVSRVIVLEQHREELEAELVARAEELKVGHGMDESVEMGPLVSQEQLDKVMRYVELARKGEGRILTGGERLREDGYYYAPTVITDVKPGTPLATDEIFGPVLVVIPVGSFEEAVRINNETDYGLTSAIFTDDMDYAHAFTLESQAGMVHINHGTSSEGHLPFGGWKQSGQGAYGIGDTAQEFYTTLKAVYRMHRQPSNGKTS